MFVIFWLSQTWLVTLSIWGWVFSGSTVPPDSKETELGSSDQEVWIFLRSLGVICYDRWVLTEGYKNYFKDWCVMNSQPTFLFWTCLNLMIFFNWDWLHARLNCHYKAWSYKKKKHKKITTYRKSLYKEPAVNRCLLFLDLKPLRLYVKGKHSTSRQFQSLAVRGKKLLT